MQNFNPKLQNCSTFLEAKELMEGGQVIFDECDIWVSFSPKAGIYLCDIRTDIDPATKIAYVRPIGKYGEYWYYVCPNCGYVHAVHQTKVNKKMRCGCPKHYLDENCKMQIRNRPYMVLMTQMKRNAQ